MLGPDRFTIERTTPLVSTVDGLRYRVHEGHAGPQEAADTLAELNHRVIGLMRYLRGRYLRGAGALHPGRREAVRRLFARYNPDNLAENSPQDPSGDTAYSLDKGAVVAICLRERGLAASGETRGRHGLAASGGARGRHGLHALDTLMFVTLHEITHIAVDVVDHPPEFWQTFRFLLEAAEEADIYTSPDYAARPQVYCGVKIDYNPRYDKTARSL